tara:strand:- start:31 stop:1266 length:1236 start_codon:yes stop_codon:yes gene_type:complete
MSNKETVLSFRFAGDRDLQKNLLNDKRLKKFTDEILSNQTNAGRLHIRNLLGNSLRVSESSAPEISELFTHCQNTLHLNEKSLHAFIYNSPEVNASCFYDGEEITIGISSELVKVMSKDELTFVIGHEFGHALYDHYRLPAHGLCQGNVPASKTLKLMSWSRQAEISADRAGLLCCDDIKAATNSFIKLSCGLSEEYVSLNIDDFVSQLDELKEFEDCDDSDVCYSSHPLSPLRVSALNNFWISEGFSKLSTKKISNQLTDEEVDKKIFEILNFMEPENNKKVSKNNSQDLKKTDFLIVSSYYVASADQDFAKRELVSLKEVCGIEEVDAFITNLEAHQDIKKHISKELTETAKTFKKKSKSLKCSALQSIVTIARSDGELAKEEIVALYEIAKMIGLKETFVDNILRFLD